MAHARTKGGPTDGLCQCDWCLRWRPLLQRIESAFEASSFKARRKREFKAFVNAYIDRDEDATVAEWKLRGEWPGWGWITKEVKKRKLKI